MGDYHVKDTGHDTGQDPEQDKGKAYHTDGAIKQLTIQAQTAFKLD